MLTRAVVVLCATAALAAAYTVDCDREYADCDTQLSKLREEDDQSTAAATEQSTQQTNVEPKSTTTARPAAAEVTSPSNEAVKPQPRLLDLEDLQSFANSLHNSTEKRIVPDLSDVTIDGDDDESDMNIMPGHLDKNTKDKLMPDKFYTNLKVPFNTVVDHVSEESTGFCTDNGVAYKPGDKIERGCEESCECMSYGWECSPRCKHPYIRRGRRLGDPLCFESPVDDCCSIVACASGDDGKRVQKVDTCKYENQTYTFGMSWNVGCEKVCTCDKDAVVSCKPRCPPLSQSERCINVQDPHDACCELQVCDVSQDGHEQTPDLTERAVTVQKPKETADDTAASTKEQTSVPLRPLVLAEPIGSVQVLQNNSVQVTLSHMNSSEDPIHLLLSDDGGKTFKNIQLEYTNLILNLEGGKDYVLKTAETGTKFNFTITATDEVIKGIEMRADEFVTEAPEEATSVKPKDVKEKIPLKAESVKIEEKNETQLGCMHDGMFYAIGEEFHIGCSELCECTGPEERECVALECPSHVGLELVSRGCVRWAPSPPAQPPNCCPREARCLSDGTCHFNGVPVPNWSEVPIALTGCERRCFCENGELDCQQLCAPLPPLPPATLRCPFGMHPAAVNVTDEDCCQEWSCVHNGPKLSPEAATPKPPKLPPPFIPTIPPDAIHFPTEDIPDSNLPGLPAIPKVPGFVNENKKLTVISLEADSPTSVKMLFGLPPPFVGLRGSVDLRYTDKADEDIAHWQSQVFAPADEILTTARLEFRLTGLKPSTLYKVRAKLFLHNLPVEPQSEVYTVRTHDVPVEEKQREVDSQLTVADVNDTVAHVTWRHFNEDELQYIDGIQIRYRPVGNPIYLMTELLHHSRSSVELTELRPQSRYEASLVLVAPLRTNVELTDPTRVEFTTQPKIDPYAWSVTVEAVAVGSGSVEVSWRGVPAPAERWVRVFRAAHACGPPRRAERDAFRLAARDQPASITLEGLRPDTRCRVWLELFLTNGKVKTSNVIEVVTKPEDKPDVIDNIIPSSVAGSSHRGDYYGALVAVGVIAALGAVTSLLLLLIVLRRHRPRAHNITPVPTAPRESSLPPYDNPAYKLELQQETMDL